MLKLKIMKTYHFYRLQDIISKNSKELVIALFCVMRNTMMSSQKRYLN